MVKYVDWDETKNRQLKEKRNISFEEILTAIDEGKLLATLDHPNKKLYPNQMIYIVNVNDYAYIVPFVENEEKFFLKTIFPSRKMTKKYIIRKEKK